MRKQINGKQGAALAMTLIIMAVLMILGTVFLNISSAENKFAVLSEDKTQAYYIARAGAQSVAETIIKGDNTDFIIGKTSESYSFGGGQFTVEVKDPVVTGDKNEIDITSVGIYKGINQTVTIRVEGTALGAGMFSNAFYAFNNINGGLNKAVISGDIEAGGSINLNNIPAGVKTKAPVTYSIIPISKDFTNAETINITSSKTLTAPANKKVTGISIQNNDVIRVEGTGVVSLFLDGNANIKGDIIVSSNAQLHIYMIGNHTLTIQGSANTRGKIFVYAPEGKVDFKSVTNSSLKGLIIAGNIDLSNQINFEYDPAMYDEVVKAKWIDTSNIGVRYTGYTWISND